MNNEIKIKVKGMALLPHQLRAVARAANALATELEMIPNLYCEECGGELAFAQETSTKGVVLKSCKSCGGNRIC